MEVIDNFEEEETLFKVFTDTESLKTLKETSQKFLNVNNFLLGEEPIVENLTNDGFVEYIEKNTNKEIIQGLSDFNFKLDFRSSMSNIYYSGDRKSKIFVFFLSSYGSNASVGIDVVKNFLRLVIVFGCNEGILITEKHLTARSKEKFYNFNSFDIEKEHVHSMIYYNDENFINITDHCLTPEILKIYSGKELEDFLKKENITIKEFPKITLDDPIVKFYRAKVGNIIKMKRKTGGDNSLMKEQLSYRTVIHTQFKNKK